MTPETSTRIRRWTIVLIVGLFLSGLTALPIPTELSLALRILGPGMDLGGVLPAGGG